MSIVYTIVFFFIYIWLGVCFLFIGKAYCNKATSTRCELLSNYFFSVFDFSQTYFKRMLLLTIYNWYSFVNFERNGPLKKKTPKLPLQLYNHNFRVLKFSKTKYTNQSTKKNPNKQNYMWKRKLSSSSSKIWPRFRPVFNTTYICIYRSFCWT